MPGTISRIRRQVNHLPDPSKPEVSAMCDVTKETGEVDYNPAMPTRPIDCGNCGRKVSADVVFGWPSPTPGRAVDLRAVAAETTLWLKCPNEACGEGSVKGKEGAVFPVAPVGQSIGGLPPDVERTWREARLAHAVRIYTAAEMLCRKILMHIAVDKAGSAHNKTFLEYVDDLDAQGFVTAGLKPVIDQIRKRGNTAAHDLPASTEEESFLTLTITQYLVEGVYSLPGLVKPTP